jgi:3-deoxy-D-arabino-heptulosonate 7-phosphate (DAHP) synthase class II
MLDMLKLAAQYTALGDNEFDTRSFYLGVVGCRTDGRIVHAKNLSVIDRSIDPDRIYKKSVQAHAEYRLTRKLGFGATVYVARITRGNKEFAMARPCELCQSVLRSYRVEKVYYSINESQFGVWIPKSDKDRVYTV